MNVFLMNVILMNVILMNVELLNVVPYKHGSADCRPALCHCVDLIPNGIVICFILSNGILSKISVLSVIVQIVILPNVMAPAKAIKSSISTCSHAHFHSKLTLCLKFSG